MKAQHTDPIDSENTAGRPGQESLADYVKRMETEENLRKLAGKLKKDLKKPDVPGPGVSPRDLSFEKFEEKRRHSDGQ
ncbi:hypothetical protein GCM10010967_16900 [Dyadobacter beijingensis]|uniref:Uncharacterized protein n=1 Tax=Dyadobacter beijingensis TaxID=365489 RepID=A0ABQ2HN76_9BACT|nr:hypothetical protein [Dyadobacter beijingensis]GGM85467.1 hypothetical protein GCM10010967_16900 [Dyadobacter beijingensis]